MLSLSTDFAFQVKVNADGIVNVSIRCGTIDWHRFAPAYEVEDLVGLLWDQYFLNASQKNEIGKEIKAKLNEWEESQRTPIHIRRDQMDFAENEGNTDWQDVVEGVMAGVCFCLLAVLIWIIGR